MKLKIKQGELIGKESKSIPNSKLYYSFLGIPYAEPPVNSLRFRPPVPHKGWTGVLEATKYGESCLQKVPYISPEFFGNEDCLYVNVHAPQSADKKLKPVLVFVHGGAFVSGSGKLYKPDYLMEYDVVVVTFNYRLNVFGFVNLGLPECPGNTGLKDQALLFKWVKENIEAFGGDPTNITAAGESSGGSSVHYLMISPSCKGLFNKAIIQSGSALCPWSFTDKSEEYVFLLGRVLGTNTTDKRELLDHLLSVSARDLAEAARSVIKEAFVKNFFFKSVYVPSVESGNSEDAILPEHPASLMKKATAMPLLTGLNDLEGLIYLVYLPNAEAFNKWKDQRIIPKEVRSNVKNIDENFQKIVKFYCNEDSPIPGIVNLVTDAYFGHAFDETYQCALDLGPDVPVYVYKFSYEGTLNIFKFAITQMFENGGNLKGPCHADELFYIFRVDAGFPQPPYEKELPMISAMCTLWTNFVKYGTPSTPESTIVWEPTTIEKPRYLQIGEKIQMKNGKVDEERRNFWHNTLNENSLPNNLQVKL